MAHIDPEQTLTESVWSDPKRNSSGNASLQSRPHSAAELFYQPHAAMSPNEVVGSSGATASNVTRALSGGHGVSTEPPRQNSDRHNLASMRSSQHFIASEAVAQGQRPPSQTQRSRLHVQDEYTISYGFEGLNPEQAPHHGLQSQDIEPIYNGIVRDGSRDMNQQGSRHHRLPTSTRAELTSSTISHKRHRPLGRTTQLEEGKLAEVAVPAPSISHPPQRPSLEEPLDAGREDEFAPEPIQRARPPTSSSGWVVTQLFILSYLVFLAIWGTLARLGLQWLTFYPGAPTALGVLWANFAGSLLMGFFSEDRMLFRESEHNVRAENTRTGEKGGLFRKRSRMNDERFASFKSARKSMPLYIGLTTGFCGSLTSFSSFMRDAFFALSNDLPTPFNQPTNTPHSFHASGTSVSRNGGYSFMALLAVVILTLCVSLGGLQIGAHLALAAEHIPLPLNIFGLPRIRTALDYSMPILATGSWLGAVFLAIWPPDRPGGPSSRGSWSNEVWRGEAIFACVFAPLGCLLRYIASLHLNQLQPAFPMGTFAVNMFGTAVLGMTYDLQHVRFDAGAVGGGRVGCQVLQGVEDGFCGALTTVSTWVIELSGLRKRNAWIYGSTSVGVALALLVVIMGSVRWTVGWTEPACVT